MTLYNLELLKEKYNRKHSMLESITEDQVRSSDEIRNLINEYHVFIYLRFEEPASFVKKNTTPE